MTPRTDVQRDILAYLLRDAVRKLSRTRTGRSSDLYARCTDAYRLLGSERLTAFPQFHEAFVRVRNLYALLGGALTADLWQSPAYRYVIADESGSETGKIKENFNDYKRDQHSFGVSLEKAYASAYLSGGFRVPPSPLACVSGMAALTVAAVYIGSRLGRDVPVAVGEHSYFENKELLESVFGSGRIEYFNETDPGAVAGNAYGAVFFDSQANDPDLTRADTRGIVKAAGDAYVVIDVTASSPVSFPFPVRSGARLIGFESLNKYHQYGLDRVTGGMLFAYGIPRDDLYRVRDHAGVNIPEQSAATVPSPNAALLARYMQRLRDNAVRIGSVLSGLRGVTVAVPQGTGTFLSVRFDRGSTTAYRRAIGKILDEAGKRAVPLVAGSTFGTPATRVYTWDTRSPFARPFLRISPGLETPEQIDETASVIRSAITPLTT